MAQVANQWPKRSPLGNSFLHVYSILLLPSGNKACFSYKFSIVTIKKQQIGLDCATLCRSSSFEIYDPVFPSDKYKYLLDPFLFNEKFLLEISIEILSKIEYVQIIVQTTNELQKFLKVDIFLLEI